MDTGSENFRVLVDVVNQSPRALASVHLKTAKEVLRVLLEEQGQPLNRVISRVGSSPYALELLEYLSERVDGTEAVITALLSCKGCGLSRDLLRSYAHDYWLLRFATRIARKDYRRAWVGILAAYRGFNYLPLRSGELILAGTPMKLAAPLETIVRMVNRLFEEMLKAGRFEGVDVRKEPKLPEPMTFAEHTKNPYMGIEPADNQAGLQFALGFYASMHDTIPSDPRLPTLGNQILLIARCLADERKEKRNRKVAAIASEI